jgi:hypothetical protein
MRRPSVSNKITVKTTLRRAKKPAGLDRAHLSAQPNLTDKGNGSSLAPKHLRASRWSAARRHTSNRLLTYFHISVDNRVRGKKKFLMISS